MGGEEEEENYACDVFVGPPSLSLRIHFGWPPPVMVGGDTSRYGWYVPGTTATLDLPLDSQTTAERLTLVFGVIDPSAAGERTASFSHFHVVTYTSPRDWL